MAFSVGDLIATIKADVTDFKHGISQAKEGLNTLGSNMTSTSQTLAKGLGVAAVAAGALAVVIGKQVVQAAAGAEVEMMKFEALISSTFGKAPKVFREMREGALATSEAMIKLGFDDEETAVAMAKSLAVTKDLAASQKEMALAADFARLRGIGLGESQTVLQMAYMGNQRALKQYGIELSDTATKEEIMAAVSSVAAGQAQAFANTYAGQMEVLKVKFGNIQEEIGAKLLPALLMITDWLINVAIPNIGTFTQYIVDHKDALIAVAIGITAMLVPAFFAWAAAAIPAAIATVIATAPLIIMGAVVAGLAFLIISNWTTIVATTIWLKDQIVLWFTTMWDTIKTAVDGIVDSVKTGWDNMVNKIKEVGGRILDAIMWPFEEAKRRVQEAVNFIKDKLDFTQRHSPSVLDIVKRGVGLVNNALGELPGNIDINPNVAFAGATSAGTTNQMSVSVDMAGAVIGDMSQAGRLGEMLGDSIIKRLKLNVRI